MKIGGLQKTTLLDYPGKVACTVFLSGCNFRCPFCQNAALLDGGPSALSTEQLLAFLRRRQGVFDGVCVSGGEPLLHADLPDLLQRIKELGFLVKLDTNGSFPGRLRALAAAGLIDFVAMDIKNAPARYDETAGVCAPSDAIWESADFLLGGGVEYEFRTTVVHELHTADDMAAIGRRLRGAARYFLQNFRDGESVLQAGLSPCSPDELQSFLQILRPFIPSVRIRGEFE